MHFMQPITLSYPIQLCVESKGNILNHPGYLVATALLVPIPGRFLSSDW